MLASLRYVIPIALVVLSAAQIALCLYAYRQTKSDGHLTVAAISFGMLILSGLLLIL